MLHRQTANAGLLALPPMTAQIATALGPALDEPVALQQPSTVHVRFSNRPFGVKHFQTVHHCGVDVARGLALLFGIGTRAVPLWGSKTRWNNL
jgi:hypothetical protein